MVIVTASCQALPNYVRRGRPVNVQRNGLANTSLKYRMKFSNFCRRSSTDLNLPRRITFRAITPKTISIWLSQDVCLGRYTKRMRWPRSDKNSCRVACERWTPALVGVHGPLLLSGRDDSRTSA